MKNLITEEEFESEVRNAATQLGREKLKARFVSLEEPDSGKYKYWWWVVAVLAALVLASIFLLKPKSDDALYADFYTKMPNKVIAITRGDNEDKELKLAFISYEKGEYEQANDLFSDLSDSNSDIKIYQAIIELEKENFTKAEEILVPLANDDNYKFQEEAQWYLSLAYLKTDQRNKSVEWLEKLYKNLSIYGGKAAALLKKLA